MLLIETQSTVNTYCETVSFLCPHCKLRLSYLVHKFTGEYFPTKCKYCHKIIPNAGRLKCSVQIRICYHKRAEGS